MNFKMWLEDFGQGQGFCGLGLPLSTAVAKEKKLKPIKPIKSPPKYAFDITQRTGTKLDPGSLQIGDNVPDYTWDSWHNDYLAGR